MNLYQINLGFFEEILVRRSVLFVLWQFSDHTKPSVSFHNENSFLQTTCFSPIAQSISSIYKLLHTIHAIKVLKTNFPTQAIYNFYITKHCWSLKVWSYQPNQMKAYKANTLWVYVSDKIRNKGE